MGCGILHDDLSRAATITGSATLGDGALSNLQDDHPRVRARFGASPASIVLDLGAAWPLDCAALISTGLSASAQIRLRTSEADATFAVTNSDTGTVAAETAPKHNGQVIRLLPATQSVRYLRWDITNAPTIDIGLVPCGLLTRLTRAEIYGGPRGHADGGIRDVNPRTGAHFTLAGPRPRFRQVTLPRLTPAEAAGAVRSMDRDLGLDRDVLFVFDLAAAQADLNADSIWGAWKVSGADGTVPRALNRHARSFSLLERL